MYLLYDAILLFAAAGLIPYYLVRSLRYGKSRRGVRERLGYYEPGRFDALRGRQVIWVHAVSVGETRAAIPLLKGLRKAYPDAWLLLSNVTETGHAVASTVAEIDQTLFFPFDLSWVVRKALVQVHPDLIIIVETEIWPNFVRAAHQMKIPLVLVNGRISDRSYPRYRMLRRLLRPVLQAFTVFCMQSAQDAARIAELGARSATVVNTGNLKFDLAAKKATEADVEELKHDFRLSQELLLIAAGSTHAGEEDVVLQAFSHVLDQGLSAGLVLVPRHPERCRMVADMLTQREIPFHLRSQLATGTPTMKSGEVLLVDTLGEMLNVYRMASVVFVGGSLVPVGGHNLLEASLVGKPVLFGPEMHNFREISRLLLSVGGGRQVNDAKDLETCLVELLTSPEMRRKMGQAGQELIERNTGATARTLEVLAPHLGSPDA